MPFIDLCIFIYIHFKRNLQRLKSKLRSVDFNIETYGSAYAYAYAVDRTLLAIKYTKYMNFPLEYCILFMNTLIIDLYITFIMMPFS